MTPRLILHAGAGLRERTRASAEQIEARLDDILTAAWAVLAAEGARACVRYAVEQLEHEPLFNAGTGSKLQADGVARMSASIMSADDGIFSGVINVEGIAHPVVAADRLHGVPHHVLAGTPALDWLRCAGFSAHDPVTDQRREEWREGRAGRTGTVGAVALDATGVIAAATSTGGVGMEQPGRVSDSATVAGNYASAMAGVSVTGVGEHIVHHAVAARVVVRCTDGLPLSDAVLRTLDEASQREYQFGLIALAADGSLVANQTPGVQTLYAARCGERALSFLQAPALHWPAKPSPS